MPFSAALRAIAADPARKRLSVGDLLAALGDRAVGALLFIFACPNILPTPPGASTILGAPMVFLAAQLMLGRKPWLPRVIAERSMSRSDVQTLVERVAPWLERAERLLRPRATALALPPMEYLVGLVCLVLATIVVLPIPLGNVPPAIAISFMALGVIERDGYWVLAGLAVGATAIAIVSGVTLAMFKAGAFLVTNLLQ